MNVHKASLGVESRVYDSPENDPDHHIKYKLANLKGESIQELIQILKNGGRFIVFYYRVAIIAVSFQRVSPAVLIRDSNDLDFYRKKYNRMALLKGLLFFPFGPLPALKEIKLNNKGGLDVTGDILINLTEEDLKDGVVYIRKMHTIFGHVGKSELKYFRQILTKYTKSHPEIKEIYVALYLNVDQYEEPPFCIGVSTTNSIPINFEDIEKALYKEFRNFNQFFHIDLNDPEKIETEKLLKSQGQKIFSKEN